MPNCAPTPEPTITAVGVARPRAHGHAITSVAAPNMKAIVSPSGSPDAMIRLIGTRWNERAKAHADQVTIAIITTIGTKY